METFITRKIIPTHTQRKALHFEQWISFPVILAMKHLDCTHISAMESFPSTPELQKNTSSLG
jgi:hypothetical protein